MGQFGDQLLAMGTGIVGNAVNTGLGIIFGRSQEAHNDARQLAQQQKLQALQIQGQKEMTDYNFQKQLDMWNSTNYEAQMKHLADAGLNPGLLYGMGGGGGQTASISPGNVSGAEAPKGGHESFDQQGMGIQTMQQAMQLQLLHAQKENIEADTKEKLAQVPNVETDTAKKSQEIENLFQGLENLKQDYEVKRLDIAMKNMENYEKQATQADRIDYITYQAYLAKQALTSISIQQRLDSATVDSKIKIIKQQAIMAVLENVLKGVDIQKGREEIILNREKFREIANNIQLSWENLSNEHKRLFIQDQLKEFTTDPNREAIDQAVRALGGIIDMSILKQVPEEKPRPPIGFKR